jgi:hypothetical protein
MAFRIERKEPVGRAVARIVREELALASSEASNAGATLDARVHAVRARAGRARLCCQRERRAALAPRRVAYSARRRAVACKMNA